MKCAKFYFVFFTFFAVFSALAQDIHLTQFFTNPLIISPSNTGNFQGNIRGGANYKQQWAWATNAQTFNYQTTVAYCDIAFLQNKYKHGWMGLGFNFLNDGAGDGNLRYTRLGGSIAWHQALDVKNRYVLSIGFQGNYFNKTTDFEKYYFNDQWVDDEGFDINIPSYENPNATRINGYDLGWGLGFDARPKNNIRVSATFSMLHLNNPKDQFYTNSNNQLGTRYVATASSTITMNPGVLVQADAYFTYQKKAYEFVFGGMAGVKPGSNPKEKHVTLWIGSYFRMIDAWSPIVGFSYKQCRLLVNYDVVFSKLSRASLNGGLEVSVVVVGAWKQKQHPQQWACPKF